MLKGVGGDGVSQKIYIVEDDASIRELESYALKSAGFETLGFSAWPDIQSRAAALKAIQPKQLSLFDMM